MKRLLNDPGWTESQREFVENLEAAGATAVGFAVPIDRGMSLPPRELQSLVDSGIVREAASGRYYLHASQTKSVAEAVLTPYSPPSPLTAPARSRLLKVMIFWFLIIILPIVMIQLLGNRT